MARCPKEQLTLPKFDGPDPITLMLLFTFWRRTHPVPHPNALKCLFSSHQACWEGKLTPYCQLLSLLLVVYAMHDIVLETNMDIMYFIQAANRRAVEYSQVLWTKALPWMPVYEEHQLKGNFAKGLKQPFQKQDRSYWAEKSASLQELARHTLSVPPSSSGTAKPHCWDHLQYRNKKCVQPFSSPYPLYQLHHKLQDPGRLCKRRTAHAETVHDHLWEVAGSIQQNFDRPHINYRLASRNHMKSFIELDSSDMEMYAYQPPQYD